MLETKIRVTELTEPRTQSLEKVQERKGCSGERSSKTRSLPSTLQAQDICLGFAGGTSHPGCRGARVRDLTSMVE